MINSNFKVSIMTSYLVTGANRGIGLEMVKRLKEGAKDGDVVIACSRSDSKELTDLASHSAVHHVKLDITSDESVNEAYENVTKILDGKGLNVLVNNAGILLQSQNPTNTTTQQLLHNFDVNVVGTHQVTVKFAPLLEKAANEASNKAIGYQRALCLNISSAVGSLENTTSPWHSAYRVSKAGLNMLTRCTSFEFLPKGILCCAVHPGWVQTEMGGANALITTSTCVDHLFHVMKSVNEAHSGVMVRITDGELAVMPF